MKLKQLRCEQFAGIKDREINFVDGLNILQGDNESGKSTLIDLLYNIFFQDTKLDGRRDNNFKSIYFPKSTGKYKADVIDGAVSFETEKGKYKLSREWNGTNGTSRLILPDGTQIRDSNSIADILLTELQYGKGLYDELIFASQKRQQNVLQGLLHDSYARKNSSNPSLAIVELSSVITKAVMETGGIAIEKMENRLNEILLQYGGRWDFGLDMPEGGKKRGINNPWKTGCGSILQSYYAMEEIESAKSNAEMAEKEVERILSNIQSLKQDKKFFSAEREKFSKVRSTLSERSNNQKLIEVAKRYFIEFDNAIKSWPVTIKDHDNALKLKELLEKSKLHDLFVEVDKLQSEVNNNREKMMKIGLVDQGDIIQARSLQKDIDKQESKIAGMKLKAKINKLRDVDVKVTSALSGNQIETADGEFSITEAVEIFVPGTIELQLMPQGIDLNKVKENLTKSRADLAGIFEKNNITSVEELEEKNKITTGLGNEIKVLEEKIKSKLNGKSWEELQTENSSIPPEIKTVSEIESDIKTLCGRSSVESFIGEKSGKIKEYAEKYGDLDSLKGLCQDQNSEIQKLNRKLTEVKEIPEEYQQITDPDAFDQKLKEKSDGCDDAIEQFRRDLSNAEKKLGDTSAEEFSDQFQVKREEFNERKAKYNHWKHIHEVFIQLKNSSYGNPMEDVEEHFREYLSLLTNGSISLESVDEKLNSRIISGKYPLTYEILSDGTKDTISLAFRLAVLEHLYPNGGGLAVFDDPFTDMDPKRVKQACQLIQKFAERNQVIFVTCDSKYQQLLTGETIKVS